MPKRRPPIPSALAHRLLYAAARTCCVCRDRSKAVQLHHVDQNNENNVESNLVVICNDCHDEAHTHHSNSRNLDPREIRRCKATWIAEVSERSAESKVPQPSALGKASWTYINHEKLPRILRALDIRYDAPLFARLRADGVIDGDGIPVFLVESPNRPLVTVYDRFEWDDSQRLHELYARAIDALIRKVSPLELGAIWSKREFRDLVVPGSFCFAMRGFRFKTASRAAGVEDRIVYTSANGIQIRMHANTRHMFGDSALHTHFRGNSVTSALMLAKQVVSAEGSLVLHATPLAMAAGRISVQYQTPHHLNYGRAAGFGKK